jgi:hypothetical protein
MENTTDKPEENLKNFRGKRDHRNKNTKDNDFSGLSKNANRRERPRQRRFDWDNEE